MQVSMFFWDAGLLFFGGGEGDGMRTMVMG